MNILFVTRPLGPPWNEGGKNLAYGIAKNIKNHKVHLLVRKDFNEKVNNHIILHKIYSNKFNYDISYIEKLRLFFFLLRIKNIDIFHFIYTPQLYSSRISKLIMQFKHGKSIQTIPTKIKKISNLKKLIFSDKVVTISNFTKDLFIKNGIKNVIKINSGIDTDYFKPFKKNMNLLKDFNITNKFVILIPVDLNKNKGARLGLKIIKEMDNIKNIIFIFSYRSKNSKYEEKYLRDNLIKLNLMNKTLFIKDYKNVKDLINISDIIVYPMIDTYEKHEIPMILLESMSMEKPVILFNISPFNEIINKNEGIKVNNYSEMKDSIIKLVNNKHLIKKIGKLARERIVNDFNITKTAEEYSKLYTNLF